MLPQSKKLRSSRDFTVTVRRGRRIGRKTVVLHIRDTATSGGENKTDTQIARFGGPRIGLVVSKAVGNAVTRHAVSRKLRHIMADAVEDYPSTLDIVVRALPASATATSQELSQDVQSALAKYRRSK
ncbi:MAG: ribonuclease P protein component [Corynebacterium sp.]|uniref:ribonuclease P protein component n=1 Tax=Corynebacterium sp. TaxID=1720 RepID=UPI0026DC76D2|nr:ribonuclease P protein component [Corynebacterium sp.]MDO5030250.1 ribonuclease P protein component [Corynebacterium sp.]